MINFFKLKNLIKKFLEIFNYKIEHVDSWYKRQENFISEISKEELNLIKQIQPYTMSSAPNHWAIIQSLKHIKKNQIEGELVECGVYKGGNLILFKKIIDQIELNKKIFAYDTFEGMPEPGQFDSDFKNVDANKKFENYKKNNAGWCYSDLNEVKKNIFKFNIEIEKNFSFIKGKVENTLMTEENLPKKISLLRLDTDFYESTKIELDILFPKLQPGGILIIDDYGHWNVSKKAVDEYFDLKNKFHWFHRIDYASRLFIK